MIASDLPVLRQVAGGVPDFLDPIDAIAWIRAIEDYARPDSPRRAAQLSRMQGYQAPSWQTHFSCVDAFVEGLDDPLVSGIAAKP